MDKAKIHHRSWQQKNQINCRVFCPLRKHLKCKALTLNIQHECKHCRCRSWAVFMEGYVKTGKCRFFQVARRHFIIVFSSVFSWVHEATLDKYAQMSLIHKHISGNTKPNINTDLQSRKNHHRSLVVFTEGHEWNRWLALLLHAHATFDPWTAGCVLSMSGNEWWTDRVCLHQRSAQPRTPDKRSARYIYFFHFWWFKCETSGSLQHWKYSVIPDKDSGNIQLQMCHPLRGLTTVDSALKVW